MPTHKTHKPKQTFKPVIVPWRCKKCKDQIGRAHVITIDGIDHLMIGQAKVFRLEIVCACGTANYWNQRLPDMISETEAFFNLLVKANQPAP